MKTNIGINMSSSVLNSVNIHIIPFYFEKSFYKELVTFFKNDKTSNTNKWVQYNLWEADKTGNQIEMDIFSFFRNSICESEVYDSKNLGMSFIINDKTELIKIICNLEKFNNNNERIIEASVYDLGLIVFKEGIGFLWYELKFDENIKLCSNDYVTFQNISKELSRSKYCYYVEKGRKHPIGKWIVEILNDKENRIRFFAERELKSYNKIIVPDKTLLFNYLFVENVDKVAREILAYRVTNGFDEKYCPPENIDKEMYEPFGNASAYITKSGMSYVVNDSGATNSHFFMNFFPNKFKNDYFFIYIILLYQSYSCFYYSNKLAREVSPDINEFEKDNTQLKNLKNLEIDINLFLVKGVYGSVSNVHHQDKTYKYGREALCIDNDMQSLTIGLGVLRQLETEREQDKKDIREERINTALTMLSLMTIISAFIDAISIGDWYVSGGLNRISVVHICLVSFIFILVTFFVTVLLKNKFFIKKNNRKK